MSEAAARKDRKKKKYWRQDWDWNNSAEFHDLFFLYLRDFPYSTLLTLFFFRVLSARLHVMSRVLPWFCALHLLHLHHLVSPLPSLLRHEPVSMSKWDRKTMYFQIKQGEEKQSISNKHAKKAPSKLWKFFEKTAKHKEQQSSATRQKHAEKLLVV